MRLIQLLIELLFLVLAARADVNVRNCAPEPELTAIVYGDLVNCAIGVVGDTDVYRFPGLAGEKVDIVLMRYNSNAHPCFRVIEPDGVIGGFNCSGGFATVGVNYVVQKAGLHQIQVADNFNDETFQYGLVLHLVYPSTALMTPITTFGLVLRGDILPRGDSDLYRFRGTAGDTISLGVSRLGGVAHGCFRLIQPNGTIGSYACDGGFPSVRQDIRLTQTGIHVIQVVDNFSDETHPYNLEVQCLGVCPNPNPNDPVTAPVPGRFVPVTPCRIADTRLAPGFFGGPILNASETRVFPIPASACSIPANAKAYSLNTTVVPDGPLAFLTMWPAGQTQPLVSTLNSFDGTVTANAAIVPAGVNSAINVFVTNRTHVVLDINGYFVDPVGSPQALAFFPVNPCRVADTRNPVGPLGGPALVGGAPDREFIVSASACGIPLGAAAYSLNVTVVPLEPLAYLTMGPCGLVRPLVSTLNSFDGTVVANAAIVPAGAGDKVCIFVTGRTEVILDINGYFAPPGSSGLQFYSTRPCRISDTRNPAGPFGGPTIEREATRDINPQISGCAIPANATVYSTNATVVPPGPLAFLTLWPTGQSRPLVSTLNSFQGKIVANAAIVPSGANGSVSAYVTNRTDLILDINGYFAP